LTTQKTFSVDTKPGIQRDGTVFDMNFYTDGKWVRFQRGRPRKMWGYIQITNQLAGPSRGIYIDPKNGYTTIYSGYSDGLQSLVVNQYGVGTGITDLTIPTSAFTVSALNLWQLDSMYDVYGSGAEQLIAHPGQNLAAIDSNVNTPVLRGDTAGSTMSKVGTFTASATTNGTTTLTLGAANALVAAGQTITGTGIPTSPATTVVSVVGTAVTMSAAATNSTTITATFDNNISVSGGCTVLHPYLFVYGNFGLIQNCSAGNLNDWVSATTNKTYVSSTKIVKGLPVRGGANAPSGLFWSLDSLIRVSYVPTTTTVGTTSATTYWRYDIITSQSSIMSSQSVIEYDGIFYWVGIDRFLMYGGTVKEVPNSFNQNYFFDNINYAQRQKVWAQKVPRFGEIWWYYPRGTATECTDAVVYNIREQCWYDAGQAIGARRCAGYYSQVFHYPVATSWETSATAGVLTGTLTAVGSAYTNGTYAYKTLTGGTGTGATATIVVTAGSVASVTINNRGTGYTVGNQLSATIPGGSGFIYTVNSLMNFAPIWQHEVGVDSVTNTTATAIESFFETSDLGLVAGGPSEPSMVGMNKWLRLERVEPDFVQTGDMTLYITGRPYAQVADQVSQPYVFSPTTGKIDMKEQRRELRLRFVSNVQGGDYQLGKVLLDGDTGDVRGYS
jgi:hypothetical protein